MKNKNKCIFFKKNSTPLRPFSAAHKKLFAIIFFVLMGLQNLLHAQINVLPYYEPFNSSLNGWFSKGTGAHDFKWYANEGLSGAGGLRSKLPGDSNYFATPAIYLQAGKTYTYSFKMRQATSDQARRMVFSFNTNRTRIGATTFLDVELEPNSYTFLPFKTYNPSFTVPATGYYYIINWLSTAGDNTGYLFTYFDDVTIEETVPPTVIISTPISGTSMNESYDDSTKVLLQAIANDVDGSIDSVIFYADGVPLGKDITAPYELLLKDVEPGQIAYTAVAYDNRQNFTASPPVSYTVNFRDGTLSPYVQWDFETNNPPQTYDVNNWSFKASFGNNHPWTRRYTGGFHNSAYLYTTNPNGVPMYAASPAIYLSAAAPAHKVELVGQGSSSFIHKLYLSTSQNLADTIMAIDTFRFLSTDVCNRIISKNFTLNTSGVYHLIIRSMSLANNQKCRFDNIRVIGGLINLGPATSLLKPIGYTVAAENSNLTLQATAFDTDPIQRVEYYANNVFLGQTTTAPYTFVWNHLPIGNHDVYAKPFDVFNVYSESSPVNVKVVAPEFISTSYLGGSGADDVRATFIKANNDVALIGNFSANLNIGTAAQYFINGATIDSLGAMLVLAADGKTIKSITRFSALVSDAAKDRNDNFYMAAFGGGALKINASGTTLIWKNIFTGRFVNRIDVGNATARSVVMTSTNSNMNAALIGGTNFATIDSLGTTVLPLSGVGQYGGDVCIDEKSQTIIMVGCKNFNTPDAPGAAPLPVYVPIVKAYDYNNNSKYVAYNWDNDETSPRWLNRSNNNMADFRLNRCAIGKDGKLYIAGQVYGGNHVMRYDPFDIMQARPIVGGDNWFSLANTGTETHVYFGRFEPATGNVLTQQVLSGRLSNGKGNSVFIDDGAIDADTDGNIYLAMRSASGMPQGIDYWPGEYTGGAIMMVTNAAMNRRILSSRIITTGSNHAVFALDTTRIIFGGSAASNSVYNTPNPLQLNYGGGSKDAIVALVNTANCTYPATSHALTAGNSAVKHVAAATDFVNANCEILASLISTGANAIKDSVNIKVYVDPAQSANFVKRHFEITPYDDFDLPSPTANTQTGRVILYVKQSEFDDFNAVNTINLPAGSSDVIGVSNLLIEKLPGISSDGSGKYNTYNGTGVTINPNDNDIVWNAAENRWEISFNVNGFSGFFIKTLQGALNVNWLQVTGNSNNQGKAIINWKVNENNTQNYTVEKSYNGTTFSEVATVNSRGNGTHSYSFIDTDVLQATNYFRIKQKALDGSIRFSSVVKLYSTKNGAIQVYPNPVFNQLQISQATIGQNISLLQADGKVLKEFKATTNAFSVDMSAYAKGIYLIKTNNGITLKIIKQ